MIKKIESIINLHKGKPGYVIGLGPSLSSHLQFFKDIDKESNCVISCNNVDIMTDIIPHYWVIANNLPEFAVHNNSTRFNKMPSCLIYNYRADGSQYSLSKPGIYDSERLDIEENMLSIDFIPFHDAIRMDSSIASHNITELSDKTFHESYCEYVGVEVWDPKDIGASLTTVALHMLKIAIMSGCNPIKISGVDLDYTKGYVNNSPEKGNFESASRRALGMDLMNGGSEREKTLKYFDAINKDAMSIGVEIYSTIPDGFINSVFPYKKL